MFESLHELWYRIRARFRRDVLDAELAEELKAHAEFIEEEAIRAGASPDKARRVAAKRLGNMTNIREATRERWSFGRVDALMQDARYAFRFLRRSPGFTSVAVLSLALGIGANATVFTVADKLLFSAPAHIQRADELWTVNVQRKYLASDSKVYLGMTYFAEYLALKAQASSFTAMALATASARERFGRGPLAPRIKESMVTSGFFDVLGVRPHRGRFFLPDDEIPGRGEQAAVISYAFWKRQFGAADSAVGAHIKLTDVPLVIVGVAPDQFTGADLDAADVWVPLGGIAPLRIGADWKEHTGGSPKMVVRLKPGVSTTAAAVEATVILRRLPDQANTGPVEESVTLGSVIEARGPADKRSEVKVSMRLVVASMLVLLAACANLANLMLVRTIARRRELAMRLAIGATRMRLVQQMLIEAQMIAFAGSCVACLAVNWSGAALRKLIFPGLQWGTSTMNLRVFLFSMLCGIFVATIVTIAPAIRMTRSDVSLALRASTTQAGNSTGKLRKLLLTVQIALSVVLVVGAALFGRSLNDAYRFDMGFDLDRLVTARFTFESDSLNPVSRLLVLDEAARRARSVAGVLRATVVASLPLAGATNRAITIPEHDLPSRTYAVSWSVTPDLLPTMGFRLVRGRWIDASDVVPGAIAPILLSETGARTLWSNGDPVGRCVRLGTKASDPCHMVIGVIKDLRSRSLREDAGIAMLIGTNVPEINSNYSGYVVIRSADKSDLEILSASVRDALLNIRPDIANITVKPIATALDSDYRPLQLGAATFASFAALALILCSIGVYGVLSFSVAQRTNEFGIRAALGARSAQLVASVVRDGLRVIAIGVPIGLVLSWYASTEIAALLFQAGARDAAPYINAAAVLAVVGLVSSVIPAVRVTRVDPASALRVD